ncbi:MAG: hypothetical protein JXR97_08360 [Planctomycetes bacterium]|nr:hypothetical protein [Planctomycetota bacterium]
MNILTVSLNSCIDRTVEVRGFAIGAHTQGEFISEKLAGKAINISRILSTFDIPTILFGFVGRDFKNKLSGSLPENVGNLLSPVFERTRVNTTIIDPQHSTDTHIRETGSPLPHGEAEKMLKKIITASNKGDLIILSGSIPPGMEAAGFGTLVGSLVDHGFTVAVDIEGAPLRAAVNAGCHIIKPNEKEFISTFCSNNARADTFSEAKSLCEHFPNLTVILSAGQKGAYLVNKAHCFSASCSDTIKPVNTVGAGDALLAGYACGLKRALTPAECLSLGVQTATASLLSAEAGAITNKPELYNVIVLAL